ncbi:hypothetical protein [Pseudescherichia sp.]|uniref:hypothetical protein n=1 Tax=Pseudescherichia sp. TaxID=2055881 RepID=UPI0028994B77|nr:hypothetical protein [Pseudescherichia sp.]
MTTQQIITLANARQDMLSINDLPSGSFECKRFGSPTKTKKTGHIGIRVLVTKSSTPFVNAGTYLRLYDAKPCTYKGSLRWFSKSTTLTIQIESEIRVQLTNNKALYRDKHFSIVKEVIDGELPRKAIIDLLGKIEAVKGKSA